MTTRMWVIGVRSQLQRHLFTWSLGIGSIVFLLSCRTNGYLELGPTLFFFGISAVAEGFAEWSEDTTRRAAPIGFAVFGGTITLLSLIGTLMVYTLSALLPLLIVAIGTIIYQAFSRLYHDGPDFFYWPSFVGVVVIMVGTYLIRLP